MSGFGEDVGRQRRLLVLDDDAMIGDIIKRVGELSGYECQYTSSAYEFLNKVQSWGPDVLALDLLMPDMDGVEVMSRLSAQGCNAQLIITSGVSDQVLNAAQRSASGHGLTTLGVLSKPFSTSRLRKLLSDALVSSKGQSTLPSAQQTEPTLADLHDAIETGAIEVAYQPKVYCKTGTLAGFEALARWKWSGRWISPDIFIAMAESFSLIDKLTECIVNQALNWLASLSEQPLAKEIASIETARLSLNISARSLTNQGLFRWIVQRCDELNIDRDRLIFELTESSATGEFVTAMDTLTRLRLQGFQLSIDDFGTGYSSMVQLVRLPFSEIKVDKSFVMQIHESAESRAIVSSIIDLGKSLGLSSTAEGVEDALSLEFLKARGCVLAQGYYIAKPMPPNEVLPWLEFRESERETKRLNSVINSTLIGSDSERSIDRITGLAMHLLSVPIALVTVLDRDTQWMKSKVGLSTEAMPREQSFCTHTIEHDSTLIVRDAKKDERFKSLELVAGDKSIRFYAGQPVCLPDGSKIGALCILGYHPMSFLGTGIRALDCLSRMVELELALKQSLGHVELPTVFDKDQFLKRVILTLDLAKRVSNRLELVHISLDELTDINKVYGRGEGDRCIRLVTDAIVQYSDDTDLIGRYRGAELLILRFSDRTGGADPTLHLLKERLAGISKEMSFPVSTVYANVPLDSPDLESFERSVEQARISAMPIGTSLRD